MSNDKLKFNVKEELLQVPTNVRFLESDGNIDVYGRFFQGYLDVKGKFFYQERICTLPRRAKLTINALTKNLVNYVTWYKP
ncbi:hypothetical protein [Neobacillus sp. Marseille-QA0830]